MSKSEPISEAFNAMVATMAAGLPDSAIAVWDGVRASALCGDIETAKRLLAWESATRQAIGASYSAPGDRATVRAMQEAVKRRYGLDEISRGWCAALWLHFIAGPVTTWQRVSMPTREQYAAAMECAP